MKTDKRALCDARIDRVARLLVEKEGVPIEMLFDRLLTFAGAHAAIRQGSAATAAAFRQVADNIENGALRSITREGLH